MSISSGRGHNERMNSKLKRGILAAAAVAVLGLGGAALAGATGGGGDDGGGRGDDGSGKPITGAALDRASSVALDHTGGGRVSDTEFQDEEGYYARDDGSNVDVHLDSHFNVLNKSSDGEGADAD
jgi:hypothetical protein